jgi:NADH-quinone oxidoreductase subunit N
VAIAVINSAISAYYYLRIVRLMFMREPAEAPAAEVRASLPVQFALVVAVLVTLLVGFYPPVFMDAARNASQVFFP